MDETWPVEPRWHRPADGCADAPAGGRFEELLAEIAAEHQRIAAEREYFRQRWADAAPSVWRARFPPGAVDSTRLDLPRAVFSCTPCAGSLDKPFAGEARGLGGHHVTVEEPRGAASCTSDSAAEIVERACHLVGRSSDSDASCWAVTFNGAGDPETPRALRTREPPQSTDDALECPETPRALRTVRRTGSAEAVRQAAVSNRSSSKAESKMRKLHLDTQWLDMYVANQMKEEDKGRVTNLRRFSLLLNTGKTGDPSLYAMRSFLRQDSMVSAEWTGWRDWAASFVHEVPFVPHHRLRIFWDLFGVPLIFYDAIAVPMQIAWDTHSPQWLLAVMFLYWALDVFVQLNTASFDAEGKILRSRATVTKRYMMSRALFDIMLVLMDLTLLIGLDFVGDYFWFRVLRSVRALRIARTFRLKAIQERLEELFLYLGIERLLLLLTVGQTCIAIFLIAHMLSCGWYLLGRVNLDAGRSSWLETFGDLSMGASYLHCVHWTLGHIMGGEVNPLVTPTSDEERLYSVLMLASSLLVIGVGISKMTNAIAELQRVQVEANDTRRKLSQVLRASGASPDLTARVLRFGMHSYRRQAALSVEDSVMGLLSKNLSCELTLCQRSHYFAGHPFLSRMKQSFPEVYTSVCAAFESHIFADSDVVFRADTVSECLYITTRGAYTLTTPIQHWGPMQYRLVQGPKVAASKWTWEMEFHDKHMITKFQGLRWLCEVSLFAKTVHKSKLKTTSFADAFTLTGSHLIACLGHSPRFVKFAFSYATEYVQAMERSDEEEPDECDRELVPVDVPLGICERLLAQEDKDPGIQGMEDLDSPVADEEDVDGFLDLVFSSSPDSSVGTTPGDSRATKRSCPFTEMLPNIFGELHDDLGIYAAFKMDGERRRAMAAMLSVIWLVRDDYASFTASQPQETRMSRDLWASMQGFVKWAGVTRESLHAVLVFLAIRGIGKAQPFLQAMDQDEQTPEDVMLAVMKGLPRKVPSCRHLTPSGAELLSRAFDVHRHFNFAQFLQGENTPQHIAILQDIIREDGQAVLQFYLMSLVGVMCGLRGTETLGGSLFADEKNGFALVAGMGVLMRLESATSSGIYWGYIAQRASRLHLPCESLEHLALARLACLTRATEGDIGALKLQWGRLSRTDREALTQHFVADGVKMLAFVFTFLPAYLVNAKMNPAVGLRRALVVLLELIDMLRADGYAEILGTLTLGVNLQELADFTAKVETPAAFMAVLVHSTIVRRRDFIEFVISPKHKQHMSEQNWSDDATNEMRALMRRMERRVGSVNMELERLQSERVPSDRLRRWSSSALPASLVFS